MPRRDPANRNRLSRAVRDAFEDGFGAMPEHHAWAAGRVNLIGEHTDHQHGWVLPMALPVGVEAAARCADAPRLRLRSGQFEGELEVELPQPRPCADWGDLIRGAVLALTETFGSLPTGGADLYLQGDLPVGAGLSSSAATSVAALPLLATILWPRERLERQQLPEIARLAEALGCGVPCGIMDPYVAVHGRPETALLLDCRSGTHRDVRFADGRPELALVDSGVRHRLADGAYRRILDELHEAQAEIARPLRDVAPDELDEFLLEAHVDAALRHVVEENARTLAAAEAIEAGDWERFGALLDAAHESLRHQLRATCPATDAIAVALRSVPGVYGARQVGGGFGGAVLALVQPGSRAALTATVAALADELEPAPGVLLVV